MSVVEPEGVSVDLVSLRAAVSVPCQLIAGLEPGMFQRAVCVQVAASAPDPECGCDGCDAGGEADVWVGVAVLAADARTVVRRESVPVGPVGDEDAWCTESGVELPAALVRRIDWLVAQARAVLALSDQGVGALEGGEAA